MRVESLCIADFYSNPDEVRQYMLTQEFDFKGNYPGQRTRSFLDDQIKHTIQEFIRPFAGEVTWWGSEASGAFQYTTANDRSWLHADNTDWAGVCYLTPDAPTSAGTGLFRSKDTKIRGWNRKNPAKQRIADKIGAAAYRSYVNFKRDFVGFATYNRHWLRRPGRSACCGYAKFPPDCGKC